MNKQLVDILIIGGGTIGASTLIGLKQLGYTVVLVEAAPPATTGADFDARTLALSPSSQRILSMLGVWDALKPHVTDIQFIHVSEQHQFGAARLQGQKEKPLGYVVELQHLNRALHQNRLTGTVQSIDRDTSTAVVETPEGSYTIQAQLIIAADGAQSMIRKQLQMQHITKNYQQHALVANIGLETPHQNKAYERFTSKGPLALLPMTEHRMSLIWANSPKETERLLALSDTAFLESVHNAIGYRLGRFIQVGTRSRYPLQHIHMPKQTAWPVVFLGNAAHTLHPIAGQGFNLALRDAASLIQCIHQWGFHPAMLQHYEKARQHDQRIIMNCTNGLVQVFGQKVPGAGLLRSLGLMTIDTLPVLKKILTRYAQGFGGLTPDLVCQIALNTSEAHHESVC